MKLRICPSDREDTFCAIVEARIATFSSVIDALDVEASDEELRKLHSLLGAYLNAAQAEAAQPYLTPNLPEGFDTVVGWLAKHDPEVLHNCDPKWDTTRDGWWLKHRSKERGLSVHKVAAPAALFERGIGSVNAYHTYLIAERFAL